MTKRTYVDTNVLTEAVTWVADGADLAGRLKGAHGKLMLRYII